MADSMNPNIITVIIDTVDGPEEQEVDLDSLTLEEVAALVPFAPGIKDYYGSRLIAELRN
jgi:hypothetical protein